MLEDQVSRAFGKRAQRYSEAAIVQKSVAEAVVAETVEAWRRVNGETCSPRHILDIGCGSGFVTEGLTQAFPSAKIYALDNAPQMLSQIAATVPTAEPVLADAAKALFRADFDLIASSMCLQWLSKPFGALLNWRRHLSPRGALFVSLPVDGTFAEWRKRCEETGRACRLNRLPPLDFASHQDGFSTRLQTFEQSFPNSRGFMAHLVRTGAYAHADGRVRQKSEGSARIIRHALDQEPLLATWNILYIVAQNNRMSPGF